MEDKKTTTMTRAVKGFRILWSTFDILGIAWTIILCTPITTWYALALARAGGWQGGDYPSGIQNATMVILSGSGGYLEHLGADSMLRCNVALRFWRAGRAERIIVTGVGVAEAMRNFLVSRGVPSEAIVIEPHARSTRQSALFVAALLPREQAQVVLVTSDYHMFRASRAFRRAGVQQRPLIARDAYFQAVEFSGRPTAMMMEILESVKILYYSARGWI
jgi:uncharacterized SAM-binding protein YcdF (DUF218 family)